MAEKEIVAELMSLRHACRRAGIAPETAFPPIRRVGHRRYVPTRIFADWLRELTSAPTA
jgi:hypothetical protein